jgi:hypothetical protein
MQGRGVVSPTVWLDDNLHVVIEPNEKTQQALDGKLPELPTQHLRDIRLLDTEQLGGLSLFKSAAFHYAVNLEHKLSLDQMLFRMRNAEILEYVPASNLVSLFAHDFLPLAIFSALRKRCSISSISRRGVSRPVFDFF